MAAKGEPDRPRSIRGRVPAEGCPCKGGGPYRGLGPCRAAGRVPCRGATADRRRTYSGRLQTAGAHTLNILISHLVGHLPTLSLSGELKGSQRCDTIIALHTQGPPPKQGAHTSAALLQRPHLPLQGPTPAGTPLRDPPCRDPPAGTHPSRDPPLQRPPAGPSPAGTPPAGTHPLQGIPPAGTPPCRDAPEAVLEYVRDDIKYVRASVSSNFKEIQKVCASMCGEYVQVCAPRFCAKLARQKYVRDVL